MNLCGSLAFRLRASPRYRDATQLPREKTVGALFLKLPAKSVNADGSDYQMPIRSHVLGPPRLADDLLKADCSCGKTIALACGTIHDLDMLWEAHKMESSFAPNT